METLNLIVAFILGAILGSFLNVCIYRLPREESIVRPRSRCPNCGTLIRWYDNIPILSFFLLRGRCRVCGQKISYRYPLVEFLTALISLALWKRFGFSPVYLGFLAFSAALLVASFIDLDYQIIPDEISLPGILVGLAFALFNPLTSPLDSFLGALCGAGGLYLVAEFYYFVTKREGLGGGDLKLLAMIGAFLGLKNLLPVLFWASLSGSIIGITLTILYKVKEKRTFALPFGPFLSLGALLQLFFPNLMAGLLPF